MKFRSLFLLLVLVISTFLGGCAGTGGLQGQVRVPVTSNGHVGSVVIGGQGQSPGMVVHAPQQQIFNCRSGGTGTADFCRQQDAQRQQQSQPQWVRCHSGGQQPTIAACQQQDAAVAAQRQPQQVVIVNNNQQQCGMWAGDCNRQLQSPVIPAAPCRMVNVLVQDQYGRRFYQQQQRC